MVERQQVRGASARERVGSTRGGHGPVSRREAFTFLELLVVAGLITLVGAMLLPVLYRDKSKSKAIHCLNNVKQLQTAWMTYSQDNDDRIILSGGLDALVNFPADPDSNPGGAKNQWVYGSMETLPSATNRALIELGLLFPYVRSFTAYKCPADAKAISGTTTIRSISMNAWMNPLPDQSWNRARNYSGADELQLFEKQSDISKPALSWVMIEEHPFSINDGWFVCDPNTPGTWWDVPASFHDGAGSLSYADGHAELKPWDDQKVLRLNSILSQMESDPRAEDLGWLQQRSTGKL